MSILRCSFKRQLNHLFTNLAYLIMGERISTQVQESPDLLSYKVPIASDIHDHYYQDGFRFSPQNTTKKSIAEDIEVHLKVGDFNWEIDQFGSFIIRPMPSYLERMNVQQHVLCNQYQQNPKKSQTCIFDFIIDSETPSLDQLHLIYQLESRAKIRQLFNHQKVIRNVWTQHQLHSNVLKIVKQDKIHKYPINLLKRTSTKDKYEKFSMCFGENRIFYEKELPFHHIYTIQHYPITQSVEEIDFSSLSQKMLLLKYGDYLDEFQFGKCEQILHWMKNKYPSVQKLQQHYEKIRSY